MATLLEMRRRIRSVRSIRQITRAMKMVAAAKLRRAQARILAARPYSDKLWDVLNDLAARTERRDHPLLEVRREDRITAVVITADRGLCGAFNSNVIRRALVAFGSWQGQELRIVPVGKVGHAYFDRRGWPMARSYTGILGDVGFAQAAEMSEFLCGEFVARRTDAVYLIYNEFKSVLRQDVVVEPLLPVQGVRFRREEGVGARQAARALAEERSGGRVPPGLSGISPVGAGWRAGPERGPQPVAELVDYLYEPSAGEIFADLLPRHVEVQLYRALLESVAAEQAARMTAMDNATKNADEMIGQLTLTMNKLRQEEITTEILEVVAGAEALE